MSSQLEEIVMREMKKVAARSAARIRTELIDAAESAIERFYNTYDPVSYRRHYYNFRNNSYLKYYSNAHNANYISGVELTPERMDDIYQHPKEEVFDSFMAGYHGPEEFAPAVTYPSPYMLIEMRRNEIIANIDKYVY